MGGAMLSKPLIRFPVDGWGCVPSRLFTWGQTMVEVMKVMVTSFNRSYACTATLTAPNPAAGHHQPTSPMETPGHSGASLSQPLEGSLLLSPGSCCMQVSVCALQESIFQSCRSSANKSHWPSKSNFPGVLSPFARYPGWGICCGP